MGQVLNLRRQCDANATIQKMYRRRHKVIIFFRLKFIRATFVLPLVFKERLPIYTMAELTHHGAGMARLGRRPENSFDLSGAARGGYDAKADPRVASRCSDDFVVQRHSA